MDYKFAFQNHNPLVGYVSVSQTMYSGETGYGFDFGTMPVIVDRGGNDLSKSSFCTHSHPFFFSVLLPEGNYDIKITMGDLYGESITTIKAESRRLMLENFKTEPGEFKEFSFTVNLRSINIGKSKEKVQINEREKNKLNWDNKLTLEFNGNRPCINTIEIKKNNKALTVFIAGDSTVVDQDNEPWTSWPQIFSKYFKQQLAIANHAESGLTLGSFFNQNRLKKILSNMKPGDYLFIEFGHNDKKNKNEDALIKYKMWLEIYIKLTKQKGGIPVIITPANRRFFDEDDKVINTLGEYPDTARLVARNEQVQLIDLNQITKIFYESLGQEKSKKAFIIYPPQTWPNQPEELKDNSHHNSYSASEIAKFIVEVIRKDFPHLAMYLRGGLPNANPDNPSKPEDHCTSLSPFLNLM